jgi:gliding motility-associated lipoprotein GldH
MTGNISKILVTGLLLALAVTSCDNHTVYSDSYRIGNEEWSMYDPARFTCPIDDTVKTCDIFFSLRTSTDYPYRNMYLFIVTSFPSGTTVTDTINATVTDEKGRWQGKGAGDLRELTIPYKSNVFFPEKGEYHFRVIHGMRDTVLKGVYDIGMKISLRDDQQK